MDTQERINQWHSDFEQTRKQWQEWLDVNFDHYKTTKDAWRAFKVQQLKHNLISAITGLS